MTLYLYGFTSADQRSPGPEVEGVGGTEVRLEEVGVEGLRAVVSAVPEATFAAETVEGRLQDLDWVGREGARHERVVTWFVDHGDILPARFLTLYSGPAALASEVHDQGDLVRERLDALRGLREWNLKAALQAETLQDRLGQVSARVSELERELEAATPGRRYLLERRRDGLVREELAEATRRMVAELFAAVAAHARSARRMPVPRVDPDASPGGRVVLNAAYLAERDGAGDLERALREQRERLEPLGFTLTFSGPWAPYRFVAEADDG